MNFYVAIFILKMEDKKQYFGILLFIISRKVKIQVKSKIRIVQCLEIVLGLLKPVKSGLRSSVLEISQLDSAQWSSRPVKVDNDQIETLNENNQC